MKLLLSLACALLVPSVALGYAVAHSLPINGLEKEAQVILKGTVVSTERAEDDSFRQLPGWAVFSTRLKVVSVLKGALTEREVDFHHYAADPDPNRRMHMFAPQHYVFEKGSTYIVFAKETRVPGVLRPLWDSHRSRYDQGQVLAADDKPVAARASVKDVVWNELKGLSESTAPARLTYAIGQLHSMSGGDGHAHDGTDDFPREQVLAILQPMIAHADAEVASAAIDAVGSRSPYRHDDLAMGWLATVGKGSLLPRGHAKYPDKWDNPDARQSRERLLAVANDAKAGAALRARAIRALGLTRGDVVFEALPEWSSDPAAEVRAAAAVLWADFPGEEARAQLTRLAADPDPAVRRGVATAVGCLQSSELLPLLEGSLRDKDGRVRATAAMSVISFDPKESAALLKAFRKDPDFAATFVNALALDDPGPYLDDLARIVRDNAEPRLHFVAQMPVYTSWQILKAAMDVRPAAELAGGKLDKYLDALDHPPNIGSGPYQEMYQFYRDKGLSTRAAQFRADAKKRVTGYDIDYYFKRVDGEP
jgi:hypothetical protein